MAKYTPILKSKAGEFQALNDLSDSKKDEIVPLIEITQVPWDYKNKIPAKTVEQHLERLSENLSKNWGKDRKFYLDFHSTLFDDNLRIGSLCPVEFVFQKLREKGLNSVPVISFGRPKEYIESIKKISQTDNRGVCFRIDGECLYDSTNLSQNLNLLLKELSLKENNVDLILDFKAILAGQEGAIYLAFQEIISNLSSIEGWRSFTISASSFPKDLSGLKGVDGGKVYSLPRSEWLLWKKIKLNESKIKRLPDFGDYSISHPETVEIDPRTMNRSASIRYSSENEWLIARGKSIKSKGSSQYKELCKEIISSNEYKGEDYSWGDNYIAQCSQDTNTSKFGNGMTWRRVGVGHHLELVVDQLSTQLSA